MIRTVLPLRGTLAALVVAAAFLLAPATASAAWYQKTNNTSGWVTGQYRVSAWISGFNYGQGYHTLTWETSNGGKNLDYLWINLQHSKQNRFVGFDAGVGRNVGTGKKVNDIKNQNKQVKYKFTNNIKLESGAFWLQGPKTIIYYRNRWDAAKDLDRQYECYIVDSTSLGRGGLVKKYGLSYKNRSWHNGAWYYHYRRTLKSGNNNIYQVFSIRAKNRNQGTVNVNQIMKKWVDLGLVPGEFYNLGWKVNVETDGGLKNGSNCGFSNLSLPWI